MKIVDIIDPARISINLESNAKMDVLAELAALLTRENDNENVEAITKILVERERLATTGVGGGVAIPHGKVENLKRIVAAIGISRTGVPFDAVDEAPVHIFVALIAPLNSSGDHLRALARISRLLKNDHTRNRFLESRSVEELYDLIKEEDGKL